MVKSTLKDDEMDRIATQGSNIAMFVSFGPNGNRRFARVRGIDHTNVPTTPLEAIQALFQAGASNVNIRTFTPDQPDGNPFFYGPSHGFNDPLIAAAKATEMIALRYHVIINETINVYDGGFSGVLYGDLCEFAACDTPRCVEKAGTAMLPRDLALVLIKTIYGFNLHVPYASNVRVEFSVHPGPVGYLKQRQLVWQAEELTGAIPPRPAAPRWPNLYSQYLGDKAYGILLGDLLGFPVPRTVVFGRTVPHFEFGKSINADTDRWVRTCPRVQVPGLFTTKRGWLDPFELMQREDPGGTQIASIIVQDGVASKWSGAALTTSTGEAVIEGQPGEGDQFMTGQTGPSTNLPANIKSAVHDLWWRLTGTFGGPVRFEWAFDGQQAWLLQLHVGASESYGDVIYPGQPERWVEFPVALGLEALRQLIAKARTELFGIRLIGNVGITSHLGDVLRRAHIPSQILR